MAAILPIPTTRVSDSLARQRLVGQVQSDQLELFRIQNQLSTGRRIFLASEDPIAALRAITLQRTAARKEQVTTSLQSSVSSLATSASSIQELANELRNITGDAREVITNLSSDSQRQEVVNIIDGYLGTLLTAANSRPSGSYIFGGSRTAAEPYTVGDNQEYIEYHGNEAHLRSYVDSDYLFDVNLPGSEVFGGLSEAVRGSVDLNPQVTGATKLSSLNGGAGISEGGAIELSFYPTSGPSSKSVIDLSNAHTLDDVARLIETHAPDGANVTVQVAGAGLRISTGSGQLTLTEVAEGQTAKELGILSPVSSSNIVGSDLDPTILLTTPLADLAGSRATGRLSLAGLNNDLVITAESNGAALNGATVTFTAGASAGASYTAGSPPTLAITFVDGVTTASDIAALVNADSAIPFQLATSTGDATSVIGQGTGKLVAGSFTNATFGGVNGSIDLASGLVVTNGGPPVTISTAGVETVAQLINRLNRPEYGLVASINEARTGIDVRTRRSGANFTIGENGGTTATNLGIRTYTASSELSELNRGTGVSLSDGPDFSLTTASLATFQVDLGSATNIGQVITAINSAAGNGGTVTARLATTGNGIELIDNTVGVGSLTLTKLDSLAAEQLGFLPTGQTTISGTGRLQSADNHIYEADSVFNSLNRLKKALLDGDEIEIGRAINRIDEDLDRLTFANAEAGAKINTLEALEIQLEDQDVQLQEALSETLDVDFVQAVSEFTARQFSLQAALKTTANLLQVSLLDYI